MSLGSGPSTFGAGVSGAEDKKRFGPDSPSFWPLTLLVFALLSPLGFVAFMAGVVAVELRRVRTSRMAAAAAAVSGLVLLAALAAGTGLLAPFVEHCVATVKMWAAILRGAGQPWAAQSLEAILPATTRAGRPPVAAAIAATAPAAIPLGLWLAALYAWWMGLRRQPLMRFEGAQYARPRPVGWMDKLREARNRRRLLTGRAVTKTHIGVGVGAYGALVRMPIATLLGTLLILGRPRQGKTVQGLNVALQTCAALRGGWLLLDFKGDSELPVVAAEFARTHGRAFLHFQPADKMGAAYAPPTDWAPQRPAHFDPLVRGNATSKTDMLVNSVGRDGDAAVYLRAQYELAQVAFQVAALAGYDRGHGGFGQVRGGFETLADLLDPDKLREVADTIGPDGRGVLADHPQLNARVDDAVAKMKRDEIDKASRADLRRLLSTFSNGPAVGHILRPGPPERTINLRQAVKKGDIVTFSLSVQDYGKLARDIGTLVLLDLANTIAELRVDLAEHRRQVGDPKAPPPWPPFIVQVEEFGSAGAEAILNVLNKAGDVNVWVLLSTQSAADIKAVDGTGVFLEQVIDQVSNAFVFDTNNPEAAELLSNVTPEVTRIYPRGQVEFAGGLSGIRLRAANTGEITENPIREHQATPGDFQGLTQRQFIWIAKSPQARVTHSFKPAANAWVEKISSVLIPPDILPAGDVDDVPGPQTRLATLRVNARPARRPAPRRQPSAAPRGGAPARLHRPAARDADTAALPVIPSDDGPAPRQAPATPRTTTSAVRTSAAARRRSNGRPQSPPPRPSRPAALGTRPQQPGSRPVPPHLRVVTIAPEPDPLPHNDAPPATNGAGNGAAAEPVTEPSRRYTLSFRHPDSREEESISSEAAISSDIENAKTEVTPVAATLNRADHEDPLRGFTE